MNFLQQTPPNPEGAAMIARFALVHGVIRRDLALVRELADEVATAPPQIIQDRVAWLTARSLIWSLQANCHHYCSFVRGHHLHEDHELFLRLRQVNPALNPAIQRLKREHGIVAKLLERIEQHARAITEQPSARRTLSAELAELADYLLAHPDWEEDTIFPTIRRMAIVPLTFAIDRRTAR
jgi:hemerythrin-like domain-containing protein